MFEPFQLFTLINNPSNGNFNGTSFDKSKFFSPPAILTSGDGKYINLSLSNYEMAREIDTMNTHDDLDNAGMIGCCLKDPEIQDLLGSFERESEESSFLRKLRGEEDFSSSLSNSLGSEVTISRESSIFRDDLLFSRNETPGLVGNEDTNNLEGSECERINLLVEKCNNSDVERYTLSFQEDSAPPIKLNDREYNHKNGNHNVITDDYQDLPVNLRRSTVNRCMNEQVLRDEIASPIQRFSSNYGIFQDRESGTQNFSANQNSSPSSSGKGYSSMSITSQESSPGSSDLGPKGKGAQTNYRKAFEELERQRREIAQAFPIPGFDSSSSSSSQKLKSQEPFDVYLSESALEEFKSSPHEWLRRTPLMSIPKGYEKQEVKNRQVVTQERETVRVERPTSFLSKKSRNDHHSPDTIYVCYPNYSLPDMGFVQKIIGNSSPGLVLSPTKPNIRTEATKAKTRPKSFGGYEKLSRENFSHIKDWDSLNVLLPEDLKKLLDESSTSCETPLRSGILRRTKNRGSRNNRFSLQEPLIGTIGEEDDEETKGCLARSETRYSCHANRASEVRPQCSGGWPGNNHYCHHPALPSPQMSHCHASAHCCPSTLKESQIESLSKEKLNKLLSMSDALEEITSLLSMVTSIKNISHNSKLLAGADKVAPLLRRDTVKKPRPVSMTSCGFKSQIPVMKPATAAAVSKIPTAPKVALRRRRSVTGASPAFKS